MMEPSCSNISELTKMIVETSVFGLVLHERASDLGEWMLERAVRLSREEDRVPLLEYDSKKKSGPIDGLLHGIASLANAVVYQLELRLETLKRTWPSLLRRYWSAVLNYVMEILQLGVEILQLGVAILVAILAMGLGGYVLIKIVGELQKWFTDSELQTVIVLALYSCFALRLWFAWRSGKLTESLVSFGERFQFGLRRFLFSANRAVHPRRWNYRELTGQLKRTAETVFQLMIGVFALGVIVSLVGYVGPHFSEITIPDDVMMLMASLGFFVVFKLKRRNRKLSEIREQARS